MYVDIISKTVCGRGKKLENSFHEVPTEHLISNVLGCWICNHQYTANSENRSVTVTGSYDIHLWYSYEDHTKTTVADTTVYYVDETPVNIDTENLVSDDMEIIVNVMQQPNCVDTEIKGNKKRVRIKTERELFTTVVGEKKMSVRAREDSEEQENKAEDEEEE